MHPPAPLPPHPHHPLDIPRHPIPHIQRPVLPGHLRHRKQPVNILLAHPHPRRRTRQLRQPSVGCVAGFPDDVDVKVLLLRGEQRGGEGVEGGGGGVGQVQDGERGFVREERGRVPGLDVLAEDYGEGGGEGGAGEGGEDGGVQGLEEFCWG